MIFDTVLWILYIVKKERAMDSLIIDRRKKYGWEDREFILKATTSDSIYININRGIGLGVISRLIKIKFDELYKLLPADPAGVAQFIDLAVLVIHYYRSTLKKVLDKPLTQEEARMLNSEKRVNSLFGLYCKILREYKNKEEFMQSVDDKLKDFPDLKEILPSKSYIERNVYKKPQPAAAPPYIMSESEQQRRLQTILDRYE
jgi:hypothetical protein